MHQEISISDTTNDMILAKSVVDSNNKLLAKEGSVLTPALIANLKKRNIINLIIKIPFTLNQAEYTNLKQNLDSRFQFIEKNNWLWGIHKYLDNFYKEHLNP